MASRLLSFDQDPIAAQADPILVFIRLKMNIGGAFAHRIEQHLVDKAANRRVILAEIFNRLQLVITDFNQIGELILADLFPWLAAP